MKSSSHKKENLWSHLKSATPLILIVSGATFLMQQFGWLNGLETTALDFMLRLREPVKPRYVWIVAIDDDDYKNLFKKQSPMDPEKLRKLIEAVVRLKPRVIGIDIDTTDSKGVCPTETDDVRIVWGQNVDQTHDLPVMLPVLGGDKPQPSLESRGIYGLPPPDTDNVVRWYTRTFVTQHYEADSLAWAVVKAFCFAVFSDEKAKPELVQRCEEVIRSQSNRLYHSPRLLTFAEPRHKDARLLRASQVMQDLDAGLWTRNDSPLKDAIVMFGGTFELSGDIHHKTPIGEMAGIELQALAVETEMQGKLVTPLEETVMVILELSGAFLLVAWHFYSRSWGAFALRVLAVPLLALASSYFAFFSLAFWASFVPVLLSVLIHELYEHFKYHRQLVRELKGTN